MLAGMLFLVLAAVGVFRLPDFYTRIQAATKASTLGIVCLVFAAAVWFPNIGVVSRCVLITIFVFLGAPVAAHILGRLAYMAGVPLWERTAIDDMAKERKVTHSAGE